MTTRTQKISRRTPGIIFIISAPSGAGKSTIRSKILKQLPDMRFSVSFTSRKPRRGERNGVDYHFINRGEFEKLVCQRRFLEWEKVHGEYYGTEHRPLRTARERGKDILVEVDFKGAASIKKRYPDSVSIFILPGSLAELRRRLRKRGTEANRDVQARLRRARLEIARAKDYDYIVENREVPLAARQVEAIIVAEHCRRSRITGRIL